uniref:SJCHGC08655 protein n=1 Tax=Schistosoma japonicum TaxID=6182 RepID=Q5D9S8_SCHJA|nr:SJCHGC08655 protein [Schistosoma japonicum]
MSRKTEPEGIRARSFKPKVSAYRSTINWDLGEKSKSITCIHTPINPQSHQSLSISLTNLLNHQPRDWLIDDYDSKHKEWRQTNQIVTNKESFTKMSLYREHFSQKEADNVKPMKPVHIPLKTSERFTNKSVYTDEYIWRPIAVDYNRLNTKEFVYLLN